MFKRTIYADLPLTAPTIEKLIDSISLMYPKLTPRDIVCVLDATFFKHVFGILVAKDFTKCDVLKWKFIDTETSGAYIQMVNQLLSEGFMINGIVVDGKAIFTLRIFGIPLQMCHFHMQLIMRKYLTLHPKLEAGIELSKLMKMLGVLCEEDFSNAVTIWEEKWSEFLKERSIDSNTNRWFYTHRSIRSAIRSLKRFLPYLYTYQHYPFIPSTTNCLESEFTHLKEKIRIHRGLRLDRKKKLIHFYWVNRHKKF